MRYYMYKFNTSTFELYIYIEIIEVDFYTDKYKNVCSFDIEMIEVDFYIDKYRDVFVGL